MKIPANLKWKATGNTLGQGGQALVYEVVNKEETNGKTFALKALAKGKPQKVYERFYREVEAIKNLNHRYIIKILDHSVKGDDFNYYVMEYIKGARSLKEVISSNENPFYGNALSALEMFIQLAEVIDTCEALNPRIVHRDLCPANILVLPDNSIKVIDFGICQTEGNETLTLIDESVGTHNYMAPECESGAEGKVSSRSDLYSAGKILWAAITGKNAFSREKSVFDGKSMRSVLPENPESWHLHHIFEKTIRHNPENRWSTTITALGQCKCIYRMIAQRYPPLELLGGAICPLCGIGELESFQGSHMVFGNPNPAGIGSYQCNYCGYCFAINQTKIVDNLRARSALE